MQRGEGDGSEEYHLNSTLPKVYEKYPLEPPELPPRDYTTDEDNLDGKKKWKPKIRLKKPSVLWGMDFLNLVLLNSLFFIKAYIGLLIITPNLRYLP